MQSRPAIRATFLALGVVTSCLPMAGCSDPQSQTGAFVPTSEERNREMELEAQSNESADNGVRTRRTR